MGILSLCRRLRGVLAAFVLVLCLCSCSRGNLFDCSSDVGDVGFAGGMVYDRSSGGYTLTGSGTNMWNTSDEFFMAWRDIEGDFVLSAKIAFEGDGVNLHRKMGLIVRESLDGDAVYADVAVHGDGLTSLQYRETAGAMTKEVVSGNKGPDHILLERRGDTIIMKTAHGRFPEDTDGQITMDLPEKCCVGLFICSHDAGVIETGYFSDVKLELKQK